MLRRAQKRRVDSKKWGLASDQELAYVLLRLTLGVAILVHGANRIGHGPEQFAAGMVKDFAGTILPMFSVYVLGLTLPFIEGARPFLRVRTP